MSTRETARRRGRGRRPARETRERILAAAGELLLEQGMASFTIEKVAARAPASRMTIYKWWPTKGALALDGYFHVGERALRFPDSGDISYDLTKQLRAFAQLLRDTESDRVLSEIIGAAQTDPDLAAAFRERYSVPRRQLAVEVLTRAMERGEIRSDVDPTIVVDQLWGACYHRLLLFHEPITDKFAIALVRNIMIGLRPQ